MIPPPETRNMSRMPWSFRNSTTKSERFMCVARLAVADSSNFNGPGAASIWSGVLINKIA